MLRTMKRLMALSLGMAFPVETHRTRLTWPRPFLLRPWLRRFTVILNLSREKHHRVSMQNRVHQFNKGRTDEPIITSTKSTTPILFAPQIQSPSSLSSILSMRPILVHNSHLLQSTLGWQHSNTTRLSLPSFSRVRYRKRGFSTAVSVVDGTRMNQS